jgi:hypothetical protein
MHLRNVHPEADAAIARELASLTPFDWPTRIARCPSSWAESISDEWI